MILPAAFSGAALRVTRTAAGRRALQVVVLVGGLFALGFLFGGQAQAADGAVSSATSSAVATSSAASASASATSSVASTVGQAVNASGGRKAESGTAESGGPPVDARPVDARPVDARQPEVGKALRPVTEQAVQSVAVRVVQPVGVGDLVHKVTAGLADVEAKAPPLPSLPSPPDSPSLPGLPGLPALPVQTLPLPVPVTPAPQPGSSATSPTTNEQAPEGLSTTATPLTHGTYGPRFAAAPAIATGVAAHMSTHRAAPVWHAPAHQAPGDPGGALSGKAAVDTGTSRHGDAHAVTFDHRAPLRLVPGAAARVDADGIRDRHRDIPVSPA
ncbi:hypothetical protein AB0I77_28875 [Streptomyces sp. NPDC050619]|uniref:hypothetical protein n=1 Tax=Streptomyces sp. NPDC050619 TaxID=3157214 RepID=UPI003412B1D3